MNTSYHPLKTHFHLTYFENPATRVCLYINKRIDPGTWSVTYISKDIILLAIRNPRSGRRICIYNVYNEVGTETLSTLHEALDGQDMHETIVLGDFNLHHPLWSARHHRVRERSRAERLLTIAEDFQLELLTVPGTTTYRWRGGESTIDLAFASEEVAANLIYYRIDRRLDYDSDHLPIAVAIN
jgi:endonuclease/exonuclease/phosphatase family metal-dependent hydrolase